MIPSSHARPCNVHSNHSLSPLPIPVHAQSDRGRSSTVHSNPRPAYHPYLPRRTPVPSLPPPADPHLLQTYAPPPSSQPSFPSSQQHRLVPHEGREDCWPRPNSSQGMSISDKTASSFRPTSVAEAHIDHWHPPPPSFPGGPPRSAAQVYQANREPKASKAPEILANLACEYST